MTSPCTSLPFHGSLQAHMSAALPKPWAQLEEFLQVKRQLEGRERAHALPGVQVLSFRSPSTAVLHPLPIRHFLEQEVPATHQATAPCQPRRVHRSHPQAHAARMEASRDLGQPVATQSQTLVADLEQVGPASCRAWARC